jgi:hypothetical protein
MANTLTPEENRIIDHLYSARAAKDAVTREQLRHILLYSDGWFTVAGEKHLVRSRPLGVGIYAVWLEKE